jgi:hypothetical protein
MGFHNLVRATEDVDLFIRATPENVEKLKAALRVAYSAILAASLNFAVSKRHRRLVSNIHL